MEEFVAQFKRPVSFTGHSLGGGLATLAALVTGGRAMVFSPAPLHKDTISRYKIAQSSLNAAASNIQIYAPRGEPLAVYDSLMKNLKRYGTENILPRVSAEFLEKDGWVYSKGDLHLDWAPKKSFNPVTTHQGKANLTSLFFQGYHDMMSASSLSTKVYEAGEWIYSDVYVRK